MLYFVLAELANMDVMYQFSLSWFQRMFATCITNPTSDTSSIASSAAHATLASGTPRPSSAATLQDSSEELENLSQELSKYAVEPSEEKKTFLTHGRMWRAGIQIS